MTTVTMEMIQFLLNDINDKAKKEREDYAKANAIMATSFMETIGEIVTGGRSDLDKLCKLNTFKGNEGKYYDRMTKLQAHLNTHMPGCENWVSWAMNQVASKDEDDATECNIDQKWGMQAEKVKEFSARVYRLLVNT